MKFNSIFSFMVPKQSAFFPLFINQCDLLIKASDLLVTFCNETDKEKQKEIYKKIKETENSCDGVTNKIFDELNSTFITPFDREDIRVLADYIDDIADFINSSAKRAVIYQPKALHKNTIIMSTIIKDSCVKIKTAMEGMDKLQKNSDAIMTICAEVKKLEKKGDEAYEDFLTSYFDQETDAIEVFKQIQVMKTLEKTTNSIHEVGKVLKTIVIKYA